jgi:glucodextranase-like protein
MEGSTKARRRGRLGLVLGLTLSTLACAAVAYADNAISDGDGVTPVTNQNMSFGAVSCATPTSKSALVAVTRNGAAGSTNVFKDSSTVTLSVQSVTGAGLTASVGTPGTITLAANWGTLDNNTLSSALTSLVTVNSTTPGAGTGTVVYQAQGSNSSNATITRTDTMDVSWTTGSCAPTDGTAPVGSVVIDSNAPFTSSTSVDLDLSATDAAGVTSYRVANGSDCSAATWVAVTATTGFAQTIPHTLASGEGAKTVCAQYRDAAGNVSATATDTIVLDTLAPVIQDAGVQSGTAGANGWYVSAVTNRFTASDAGSGLDPGCAAAFPKNVSTGSSEGTTVTVSSGACSDLAGNTNPGISSASFEIDLTDPTAILAVTAGTPGTHGWYVSDVTVTTSGVETVSGPLSCTAAQQQTAETNGAVFNGSCTNQAGRSATATPLTVKLDKTGPSAALAVTAGTLGAHGWYTSDVTVSTSGSDSVSGPVVCTADQQQTDETSGQALTGSCTNDAGITTNAAPLTVKLDKTGPSATLAVTAGTLGAHGWYTSDVTIETTGADTISGPVTCTGDQHQAIETVSQTFTGSCVNSAGLAGNTAPLTVKLDKTGPSATLTATGTLGANGWYTSDVTVDTKGTDSVSSPVVCTADQTQTEETTGEHFTGSCTNDAGLSTDATPLTVRLDKTAPSATLTAAGTLGANGWYTSNVTVETTGADTISGLVTCTAIQSQTNETTGHEFGGSCTNGAGLIGAASPLTVKLDKTAPSATLTASGSQGTNGWFLDDVTVKTTGADTISGPVTCTPDQLQTAETAGQSFNGACTNRAGLIGNATSLVVKLDKTNPSVAITAPAGGSTTIATAVTVSGTDGDATSGIAGVTVNGVPATFGSGSFTKTGIALACGSNTLTAVATDQAGRTSTDSIAITRQCFGVQFLQPLDQSTTAPIMNKGKYGRVIPVKVLLSLTGGTTLGSSVLAANGWTLQMGVNGASCSTGAGTDEIEAYADAGASAAGSNLFRWDSSAGQWIYNLDTKAPPGMTMTIGSCYRLDVYVSDGSNKVVLSTATYAVFQPTK